ncbi:MAG: hypothetical protein COX77_01935, partial [Candidatus Komeilibacteria bacterium CG_4_10_14_0_2_um_filter_37_10]
MYLDVKKKLVKSRFMQIAKGDDNLVIWHSLFGSPKIISFETLELINLFSQPISIESVCEDYDLDGDIIELFTELVSSYFLISQDIDERKIIN